MGIRRPLVSKKIGKHRYAIHSDIPLGYHEANALAEKYRRDNKSARVVKLATGWFVYYYPQ